MARVKINDEVMTDDLAQYDKHGTVRAAAPHMINLNNGERGIGVDAAYKRVEAAAARLRPGVQLGAGQGVRTPPPAAAPPDITAKYERQLQALRDEVSGLNARLRQSHREAITAEGIREKIYTLSGHSPAPPAWVLAPRKHGAPGVPMALWSDWHWGEVVMREEVGGVNEFNPQIAKARARHLVENVIDLCYNHMTNPDYPGLILCLGGDMISGDIHEELQDTNADYTFVTLLELQDVLINAIHVLAERFGRVFIPCVVGNHGRNTKKPRAKGRVYTSFEWHLYCQLERYFRPVYDGDRLVRGDPRIQFYIPGETDAHFEVLGHKFLLTHGDSLGVKGGDGIIGALGPIMRGSIKVGKSEAQIGREFDTILMGHWHQYLPLPGIIVNGSLKGYDEYARLYLRAPYQPPIQALWFVHEAYGVTAQWPVYLEKVQKNTREDWVSFPRIQSAGSGIPSAV